MTALIPTWTWGDLDLTDSPFLFGFGSDFGAPATATEALAQLLLDGEVEVSERASNRTLAFTVYIESTDLLAAAEAERALAIEADRARNTLTFDPGDSYGPATVFETYRAQLSFVRDDNGETSGLRRYDVTMKAAPFGRSEAPVLTPALPAVPEPTVATINAATATAGWTANRGSLFDAGPNLRVAGTTKPSFTYAAGSPVDLSSTNLVSLTMWRVKTDGNEVSNFIGVAMPTLTIDGAHADFVGIYAPSATRITWYFKAPASTGTTFRFDGTLTYNFDSFAFVSLQRSNALPVSGTTRQKVRSIEILGSARTTGSLAIEHATSALGSVLVYTWPQSDAAGYRPPLRARKADGGPATPDDTLISGALDNLDTPLSFDIPVTDLIAGTHQLMIRIKSDTLTSTAAQAITYSAQLRQGTTNVGPATTGSRDVAFGTTGTWRNVVLARLSLPPVDVPATSTAVVRITIAAANPSASNINLDEAWLFNTSVGDLSWVECGTAAPGAGGASNRLWLDTARTDLPRPTIFRGWAADRSDAAFPDQVLSFGVHRLAPPLMNVFTVTSNALDAAVSLSHYPAWHTHAAS